MDPVVGAVCCLVSAAQHEGCLMSHLEILIEIEAELRFVPAQRLLAHTYSEAALHCIVYMLGESRHTV